MFAGIGRSIAIAAVNVLLATKSVLRFHDRLPVVRGRDALAGACMNRLVNTAFNLWFGGVGAYSIGRLTWCSSKALIGFLLHLIASST